MSAKERDYCTDRMNKDSHLKTRDIRRALLKAKKKTKIKMKKQLRGVDWMNITEHWVIKINTERTELAR